MEEKRNQDKETKIFIASLMEEREKQNKDTIVLIAALLFCFPVGVLIFFDALPKRP